MKAKKSFDYQNLSNLDILPVFSNIIFLPNFVISGNGQAGIRYQKKRK